MTNEEARDILLKMAFAESTEFAEDRLFAFGYSDEHEALNISIEALEKQIPKKPGGDLHSVPHHRCPNCHCAIRIFCDDAYDTYCKFCGQKIDWSEVE